MKKMETVKLSSRRGETGEESIGGKWMYLPDTALHLIFCRLGTPKDVINAGLTCKHWMSVCYDQCVWKHLLCKRFKIDPSLEIAPGKRSWYLEYKRLAYHLPIVQTELLQEHHHQVLHVSFSHDGSMFATCSKDGSVLVWHSSYPADIKYFDDMERFSWKYTQFSQFNESDTLLLVSGVHFGNPNSTSGEIAVFSLQDGFTLQCRVGNRPYDIFGTWFSDHYLFSGELYWLAHLVSSSELWLNKASQETSSEHVPIVCKMYKFYNCNASSIRTITVANCLAPENIEQNKTTPEYEESHKKSSPGKASSKPGKSAEDETEQLMQVSSGLLAFSNWRNFADDFEYACPISYDEEYRRAEARRRELPCSSHTYCNYEEFEDFTCKRDYVGYVHRDLMNRSLDEVDQNECDELASLPEKILIFSTGSKTYTPHQIGFKRIKSVKFPRTMSPGPSLKERIAKRQKEKQNADQPKVEPNWLNYEEVKHRFDQVDHLIDLHGHIIGMGLSPDHRYLYVNTRAWPRGYVVSNPLDPPPIAQEIDIHVIDLVTFKEVGKMLRSHRAYTPNYECFFIFLDVSDEYVASGAEDKHGYLWDRHYGVCLMKYPHGDVVNSVAFNPKDPEMLITTSDDYTIKIWRSKNRINQLRIDDRKLPHGIKLYKRQNSRPSQCNSCV